MGRIAESRMRPWQNAGPPISGPTGTYAGNGLLEAGALLWDQTNYVLYVNEGTGPAPYWTPAGFEQTGLFGVHADFVDRVDKPISDTAAELVLAGSGVRVFGQGVAEIDSGLVAQAASEGGVEARMSTTNEAAHLVAIGMEAGVFQPDQHGQLVVDVELSNVAAITARAMFIGFVGLAADALDPPVTGATTVATLVQDDIAGLHMDSGYTDADALFGVHNKSNEAATQDLTVDGDTGPTNVAAAGTYQRFRVEITAAGAMRAFVDKLQVYTFATALDADEECSPVVYLESNSAAIVSADVRRFAAWASR